MFTQMGSKLWQIDTVKKGKKKPKKSLAGKVDFGKYMKLWRFKELKLLLPRTMEDEAKKATDDWWRVRKYMDSFTDHVKDSMYISSLVCLDESMSALVPRTTKSGNLPNLSYVERKPEPLGTEFKVAMDGLIGKALWLEIQEGTKILFCFVCFKYVQLTPSVFYKQVSNG